MLRRFSFVLYLAAAFLILSGIAYFVHYLIFRDIHHIFIYMIGDLAFLPVEVLLVALIIERVLAHREKQAKLKKLNMVVGAFSLKQVIIPYHKGKQLPLGTLRSIVEGSGISEERFR